MKTEDLKGFLDSMVGHIEKEEIELFKKIIDSNNINHNFDSYEEFYLFVKFPFEQFISGFLKSELKMNNELQFIYSNSQFIERHFEKLIEQIEGSACCADKSRTIMNSIIDFYKSDIEIVFNYDSEYTFHLPKKIFTNHNCIIDFYQGLKYLFYGNPEKYLIAYKNAMNNINK